MPQNHPVHVLGLIKKRRQRRAIRERAWSVRLQKAAVVLLAALSLLAAALALAAPATLAFLTGDLPDVVELGALLDPETGALLQPTRLYDRSGQPLMTLAPPGTDTRDFIRVGDNQTLAAVFLAAFDPAFFNHRGFSLSPTPRTLAERLAADLLLPGETPGWRARLRIGLLAAQATERYGRERILEWALNSAHFGRMVVGAGDAAHFYFGKSIEELSLSEVALLVAAAQQPDANPFDQPAAAASNQQALLQELSTRGLITPAQLQDALAEGYTLQPDPGPAPCAAPDFCAFALEQLYAQLGRRQVDAGGMAALTTLDLELHVDLGSLVQDGFDSLLVLDPHQGEVLALVGEAAHPQPVPGALLGPNVYLTAFAGGQAPASLIWDTPADLLPNLPAYENADGRFHGPITLRTALANQYLAPAVQLLDQAGPQRAWAVARQAGLTSLIWEGGSSAYSPLLDGVNVPITELAQAYGVLAAEGHLAGQFQGSKLTASAVLAVRGPLGDVLLDWSTPQTQSITSPELAYLVSDVLSDTGARDGSAAQSLVAGLGRPAALVDAGEGWMAGYSPQRVLILHTSNTDTVGSVFQDAFRVTHQELPILAWETPPGFASRVVCVPSGLLPTEDCPQTRRELFIAGQEPRLADTLYHRFIVNRLSGNLATVFSRPEFVEEQVLLDVPTDALAWAQEAGLPAAPIDYDPILLPNGGEELVIQQPALFSRVSGAVPIESRIPGEPVASYRVLVGRGLFPQEWMEIERASSVPAAGPLATWDGTGLHGLYAIQLQVVLDDGRVESHYTLVTIE